MNDITLVYLTNTFTFFGCVVGLILSTSLAGKLILGDVKKLDCLIVFLMGVGMTLFLTIGAQYGLSLYEPSDCGFASKYCSFSPHARADLINNRNAYGTVCLMSLMMVIGGAIYLSRKSANSGIAK